MSKFAPWKALERRHAARFEGGKRIWRPDFGESQPDGVSPTEVWDCKCEKRWRGLVSLFRGLERLYKRDGKHFHLCLKDPDVRGCELVVVRADRYADLVSIERLVKGDG